MHNLPIGIIGINLRNLVFLNQHNMLSLNQKNHTQNRKFILFNKLAITNLITLILLVSI